MLVHHFTQKMPEYMDVMRWATLAVDFFFCLSGFVIAHAYQAKLQSGMSFSAFMRKRLVRLYPMYALGMLVGLLALLRLTTVGGTDLSPHAAVAAFGLNIAYFPYFASHNLVLFGESIENIAFPVNSPAWSLFFELVLANVLYGATIRWRWVTPVIVALAAIGVVLAMRRFGAGAGWSHGTFVAGIPRVLFAYFAGVMIHRMPRFTMKSRPWATFAIVVGLVALFTMPAFLGSRALFITAALVILPAIVFIAAGCALRTGGLGHRVCDYLGRLSYPIYSIHYPVMMLIAGWWFTSPGPELFVLFMVASLVLSHVLLVGIDEPFRRRLSMRIAS